MGGWTIPAGSQLLSGDPVPEGAEPKADGTVLLPGGVTVQWHEIILPDGINLQALLQPGEEKATPVEKMPDGSRPVAHGTFKWPNLNIHLPAFKWGTGTNLHPVCV